MATGDDPSAAVHIFNEDEDLLDDDDDDESSDHEEDESAVAADRHPPVPLSMAMPAPPPPQVTIAVPGGGADLQMKKEVIAAVKKPAPPPDESRKLFQRLWTDEDEIELLQGFLEYTTQRCGPHNSSHPQHHHDTTAFYDQIKSKFQLDFNKNQLVEKLRRLKKKYRNVIGKFGSGKEYTFKSPHDQATFEISSKIWGNAATSVNGGSSSSAAAAAVVFRPEDDEDDLNTPNFAIDCQSPNLNGIDVNSKIPRNRKRNRAGGVKLEEKNLPTSTPTAAAAVNSSIYNTPPSAAAPAMTGSMSNVIEETVKSCLSPIFKELLSNSTMMSSVSPNPNGPCCGHGLGLARSPIPLCFPGDKMANDRWRKQHILELEVYSKRLELVQDQIREQLEELRSMGN